MKNLLLSILITITGFTSLATNEAETKQQDITTQAFELLVKNVDTLKIEGDVNPGEKLKPILDELDDYLAAHIFLFIGDEPENYKGPIKSFSANCKPLTERALSAKCELFIQYKPIGETGLVFYVGLDKDKKPQSILENRAQISRGD